VTDEASVTIDVVRPGERADALLALLDEGTEGMPLRQVRENRWQATLEDMDSKAKAREALEHTLTWLDGAEDWRQYLLVLTSADD
jgi:hypothetical protein